MLRQLWRSETCLPRRVVGFLVPSSFCPQKGQPARFLGPLWVIMVEHWSEKEHVLILRSRRIAVFSLKVCHFLCGSQILFLCCEVRIVRSSALSYPGLAAVGVVCCFTEGKWKMNGITQGILVCLQHFSSSWFDSNICGSDLRVHCLLI